MSTVAERVRHRFRESYLGVFDASPRAGAVGNIVLAHVTTDPRLELVAGASALVVG